MFESSKTVRQRIFADFYFRQTRRAFTLIELLSSLPSSPFWPRCCCGAGQAKDKAKQIAAPPICGSGNGFANVS